MTNKKGIGPFGLGLSAFKMLIMLIVLLVIIIAVKKILFQQGASIFS